MTTPRDPQPTSPADPAPAGIVRMPGEVDALCRRAKSTLQALGSPAIAAGPTYADGVFDALRWVLGLPTTNPVTAELIVETLEGMRPPLPHRLDDRLARGHVTAAMDAGVSMEELATRGHWVRDSAVIHSYLNDPAWRAEQRRAEQLGAIDAAVSALEDGVAPDDRP